MVGGSRSWTDNLRFRNLWERGQSETLGVVILLGIVVILGALLGAFVFGDFGGDDEQLLANVQGNVTLQGISLDHEGGDKFDPENVEVLLQGDTEVTLGIADDFETSNGADSFAPGDTWTHETNNTIYGGEFRLLVVHEPTNSILLDQPHSLPITGVSLLVENWQGEMQSERADVLGNGDQYEFMVQVNARDGESPKTVPMGTASAGPDGDGLGVEAAQTSTESSPLDVDISVSDDEHGMLSMDDVDGQTGNFTADWNPSVSTSSEDVVLEAELEGDQLNDSVMLENNDTTTVRVLRKKSVFEVTNVDPVVTNEGDIKTTYTVENVGANPDDVNATVTYQNNPGPECEVQTGKIAPGASSKIDEQECDFRNTNNASGGIPVTVSVPADDATRTVTIPPAEFQVDIETAPSEVAPDSDIVVDANVTNVGGVGGEQAIELDIDGTYGTYDPSPDTETVSLESGDSADVTGLTITSPSAGGPSTITLNVSSQQDSDTTDVDVLDVGIPIQSYAEWDNVSAFEDTPLGIDYAPTETPNGTNLPPSDDGSGEFEFLTGSDSSGAVAWEDRLAGENWLWFEYNSKNLTDAGAATNVSVGGVTKWSSTEATGGDWEHRLVDIAGAGDDTEVRFGVDTQNDASCASPSPCTLYYDNVTFVDHSLPLQTQSDWTKTAGTLAGDDSMDFTVDTSDQTNETGSGQFAGGGTASVAVRETLSGGDWLRFDYKSDSSATLRVLVDGNENGSLTTGSTGWKTEYVFLEGSGNSKVEFELECTSSCQFNLDDVRLSPPGASIPIKSEEDWTGMSASFESTDSSEMGFEVNNSESSVDGASGRLTAGEFANGVAEVTVTEDLSGEDAFSFDYKGSDLGIAQVSAAVTVDNDTVWTSNGDPGGWTTERIDVSGYSGPNEIAFEMRVSTETLNEEAIFFDNVTWADLPSCAIDTDSYDSGSSDLGKFELTQGDLSTCALQAKDNSSSRLLNSSSPNGLDDPQWFEPPESHDYPKRGGRISYDVKVEQSGTASYFYFGGADTSDEWYEIKWDPSIEELRVGGYGISPETDTGGSDGTGDYYRIIVDYDLDASTDTGVIYARAVDPAGNTVAHAGINDDSWVGGTDGQIGFAADGGGTVTWDNLDYGGTDFDKVLPQPGESYYTNGTQQSADGPTGVAHDGGWIHDRLPVEPGETRTYNYYVDVGTELLVSLRDGPSTETESLSDIENEIHRFTDRLDFENFRNGQEEVMVALTIDYTDPDAVTMTAKATREDGATTELTRTWSGASSHDEIFVSTYEWDYPLDESDSLRLIPDWTGPSNAGGYLYEPGVYNPPFGASVVDSGYGHSGGWVDQNAPTQPGTIERIPYFAPYDSPDPNLKIQLRDEPAADQSRGPNSGPSDQFKTTIDNVLKVYNESQTILVFDYTVPGEVMLRATSLDTNTVVGVEVVSLPAEDLPLYLSTYEEVIPFSPEKSIRYSPFG